MKIKLNFLTFTELVDVCANDVIFDVCRFCSINSFASLTVLNFLKIAPVNPFT